MSGLIDTIDLLGEDATQDAFLSNSLTSYRDSKLTKVGIGGFGSSSVVIADFDLLSSIEVYGFYEGSLKHLLLRNTEKVCSLRGTWNIWGYYSPIAKGTGFIYVPASMVDRFKSATNWSTYADQIRALEDYTVDGTITGELDETKI